MGKSPKASTKKVMQLNAQGDSSLSVSMQPKTSLPSGTQTEIKAIPRKCSIQNPYSLPNHLTKTPSPVLQKPSWSCQPYPARTYYSKLSQFSSLDSSLPPPQDIGLSRKIPFITAIHKKRPFDSILPMVDGSPEDFLNDSITKPDKNNCKIQTGFKRSNNKRPRTEKTCNVSKKNFLSSNAKVNLESASINKSLPTVVYSADSNPTIKHHEQQRRDWAAFVLFRFFLLYQTYLSICAPKKARVSFKKRVALEHKAASVIQSFFKMIKCRKVFLKARFQQAIRSRFSQIKYTAKEKYANFNDIKNMNITELITVKNTFHNAKCLHPINLVSAGEKSKKNIKEHNAEPFLEPSTKLIGRVRFNFKDTVLDSDTSAEKLAPHCNRPSILRKSISAPYHFDFRVTEPLKVLSFDKKRSHRMRSYRDRSRR